MPTCKGDCLGCGRSRNCNQSNDSCTMSLARDFLNIPTGIDIEHFEISMWTK